MVKIGLISDTHTKHRELDIPELDILIHAGDFSSFGEAHESSSFLDWLHSLDQVKYKVFIAGNHDRHSQKANILPYTCDSITYLKDSSTEILGLKIYGTPWTPYFLNWAYQGLEERGTEGYGYIGGPGWDAKPTKELPLLKDVYSKIPDDTNILVCHGPPRLGFLDELPTGECVGSTELTRKIRQLHNLKAGVYGHIHEGYGIHYIDGVSHYNVASLDGEYTNIKPVRIINI